MKKKFCWLTVFILMVMTISSVFVYADGEINVKGNVVNVAVGEQAAVVFSINSNSGVTSGSFEIVYDDSILSASDVLNLTAIPNFTVNNANDGVITVSFDNQAVFTENGSLFQINFDTSNAPVSDSPLASYVLVSQFSMINSDGLQVAMTASGAVVNIAAQSSSSPPSSEPTSSEEQIDISLNQSSHSIDIDEEYDISQHILPNDIDINSVKFKSSNIAVVKINNKGVATGLKAGKSVISIEDTKSKKTLIFTLTVKELIPITQIDIPSELTIGIGQTERINPAIMPQDATKKKLEFISSDPSIATIDKDGMLLGIKSGIVFITVMSEDSVTSNRCVVNVTQQQVNSDDTVSVRGILISPDKKPIVNTKLQFVSSGLEATTNEKGEFYFLNVKLGEDMICVIDSSSSKIKATGNTFLSNKGEVKLQVVLNGTALLIQDMTDNVISVDKINLSEYTIKLDVEEVYQIVATVAPKDATNKQVTYKSSDTEIATVAPDGTVTAIAPGDCTINVMSADGLVTSSCQVTIVQPQSSAYSLIIIVAEIVVLLGIVALFITAYKRYKKQQIKNEGLDDEE